MPPQLITATESLPTHRTPAFFLWLVDLAVLREITALSKATPAVWLITYQWLFTSMFGAGVHCELRSLGGFIATPLLAALERLVASMRTHMRFQRLGRAKLVMAERALACLVSGMTLHMSIQLTALGEPAASRRKRQARATRPSADKANALGELRGVRLLDVLLEHGFVGTDHAARWCGGVDLPLADWRRV